MSLRQRKETVVSIEEIVHTCSNEMVAQAALASLGFDFAMRVRAEADMHGITSGALVAQIVYEFGKAADPDERRAVARVMHKADQPILTGLRFLLDARLRSSQRPSREVRPEWPVTGFVASPGDLGDLGARHAG